jgi:hypothetical protein
MSLSAMQRQALQRRKVSRAAPINADTLRPWPVSAPPRHLPALLLIAFMARWHEPSRYRGGVVAWENTGLRR